MKGPVEIAIARLDVHISTLPDQTSRWTARQKNALLNLPNDVIRRFYREQNGDYQFGSKEP